ncbi:MAG: iron-containing alcohol dehydrogenase [Epulopiscium sp.]|nr:iron-containing alcohol dehydrogenase [Candidatus Epulonipiscium sp.]
MPMDLFQYYMPTKIFFGQHCLEKQRDIFKKYGSRAFIVTGNSSSKNNGSLEDIIHILQSEGIEYKIFDEVEENPSIETLEKATKIGRAHKTDFLIGIGGGSPIDTTKGIGVLLNHSEIEVHDLFKESNLSSIPIIAIPTTSGTGTETTPYAIFTDHQLQTKKNFKPSIFPEIAFLDVRYFSTMPHTVAVHTAVDALSHLVEGYLTVRANLLSDGLVEYGISLWQECIPALQSNQWNMKQREKMIVASTIGGMVISQTGTSLPHGMGYAFTYFKEIPHGKANGLLMSGYLGIHPNKEKVHRILQLLQMNTLKELEVFLKELLGGGISLTEQEIESYTKGMIENKAKLKNHPGEVSKEEIAYIYQSSCK